MKIFMDHVLLEKPIKLYDITNISKDYDSWREFKQLRKSTNYNPKEIRNFLNSFIKKENVKLSWAKYYLVLGIRESFYLQYPSLIYYSKAIKSPAHALISPNFTLRFNIIPKALLKEFKCNVFRGNPIEKIDINEDSNNEFFFKNEIDPINKILKKLTSPTFDESSIIHIIKHRLDCWESFEEPIVNRRFYSHSITEKRSYLMTLFNISHNVDMMAYTSMYLSKIGGIL